MKGSKDFATFLYINSNTTLALFVIKPNTIIKYYYLSFLADYYCASH